MERILKTLLLDIHGTGPEYVWEEVNKISNISCKDTEEALIYNLPNMNEENKYKVEGRKFNWSNLYGKLEKRRISI